MAWMATSNIVPNTKSIWIHLERSQSRDDHDTTLFASQLRNVNKTLANRRRARARQILWHACIFQSLTNQSARIYFQNKVSVSNQNKSQSILEWFRFSKFSRRFREEKCVSREVSLFFWKVRNIHVIPKNIYQKIRR